MKKLFYLMLVILFLNLVILSFAQTVPTPSQILKTEEAIEEERVLRKRLDEPQKFYIKKITFEGITLLNLEDLEKIKSLFEKRWLTREDIDKIIADLKELYLSKNLTLPSDIQYIIKKRQLIIKVKEK